MNFLVDRCAGCRLTQWLQSQGHDALDAEIQAKFNRGYPRDNIIFKDTQTAKPQVFRTGDGWFAYNLAKNLAQMRAVRERLLQQRHDALYFPHQRLEPEPPSPRGQT